MSVTMARNAEWRCDQKVLKGSPDFLTVLPEMTEVIDLIGFWLIPALLLCTNTIEEIVSDLKRIKLHSMREQLCWVFLLCTWRGSAIPQYTKACCSFQFLQKSSFCDCALWHVIMTITWTSRLCMILACPHAFARSPCHFFVFSASCRWECIQTCSSCIENFCMCVRIFFRNINHFIIVSRIHQSPAYIDTIDYFIGQNV